MTRVRHYIIKQQRSGAAYAAPVASVHKDPLDKVDDAWKQCGELNAMTANVSTWSTFFWVLTTATQLMTGDSVRPVENS